MARRSRKDIREARASFERRQKLTGYDMVEMLLEQGWEPPVEVGRVEGRNRTGQLFVQVLFECGPREGDDRAQAWGAIGCEVVLDPDMQDEVKAGTLNLGKMAAEAAIKAILEKELRPKRSIRL